MSEKKDTIKEAEIVKEKEKDVFLEGKSIDEIIEEENYSKQGKNYLALIILLAGALIGSLFVDVAQLLSKKGYSINALRSAKVFSLDNKTWVAYKEPIVNLMVLTVSEEKLKECPACKPPTEVIDLFSKVMPTLVIKEVDIESEEGKTLIAENNVKVLPAMIFSDKLEKTEFYDGEAKILFLKTNDTGNYMLSLAGLGLPIGKYLEIPTIEKSNPTLGNKDAPVKIILFSDHQCPYSAKFFNDIVSVSKEFEDKVLLAYKNLPLEFHPQAMNAAIAGECAKDQDKFWEMSTKLHSTQKQWGDLDNDKAKIFFKKQALLLKLDDIEEFDKCLTEDQHKDEIEKSKKQAEEFGVTGTPGIFINDEFIGGVIPAKQLKSMIQAKIDETNEKDTEKNEEIKENSENNDNE